MALVIKSLHMDEKTFLWYIVNAMTADVLAT